MERRGRTILSRCVAAAAFLSLAAGNTVELPPYQTVESYGGQDFFTKFDFWAAADPTHGYVTYVGEAQAKQDGLIESAPDHIIMAADSKHVTGPEGRPSVRIQSKAVYNHGLFVADIDHIPTGCGTWPAFWMYGEDSQHIWPRWGEYDIIEGLHEDTTAMTTLHTTDNCNQASVDEGDDFDSRWELGAAPGVAADNCFVGAKNQWNNQGCSQEGPKDSMGANFNMKGGGTYAAEWDPIGKHIRTWFWPRGSEPMDLREKRPRPETWGTPYSFFTLQNKVCAPQHFKNMRIVFDLTFCGDFGDAVWGARCPGFNMTCADFVKKHPEAMKEAYWSVRSLDVYDRKAASAEESPVIAPPPPSPVPTTSKPLPSSSKSSSSSSSTRGASSTSSTPRETTPHGFPELTSPPNSAKPPWPAPVTPPPLPQPASPGVPGVFEPSRPPPSEAQPDVPPAMPTPPGFDNEHDARHKHRAEVVVGAHSAKSWQWEDNLSSIGIVFFVFGAAFIYFAQNANGAFWQRARTSGRDCIAHLPFCEGDSEASSVAGSVPGSPLGTPAGNPRELRAEHPPSLARTPPVPTTPAMSPSPSPLANRFDAGSGNRFGAPVADPLLRSSPAHPSSRQARTSSASVYCHQPSPVTSTRSARAQSFPAIPTSNGSYSAAAFMSPMNSPGTGAYQPGSGALPPGSGAYPPGSGALPPGSGHYPAGGGTYPGSGAYPPGSAMGQHRMSPPPGSSSHEAPGWQWPTSQQHLHAVQPMQTTPAPSLHMDGRVGSASASSPPTAVRRAYSPPGSGNLQLPVPTRPQVLTTTASPLPTAQSLAPARQNGAGPPGSSKVSIPGH